jgi:hypothetical protein
VPRQNSGTFDFHLGNNVTNLLRNSLISKVARHFGEAQAHEFGYYDQMHMVHDFAEFTDKTPTETLIQLETVFVDQIKTIRSSTLSAESTGGSRLIL